MFMIVAYPWPVPSAHVQLTGPAKQQRAPACRDEHADDAPQPALAGAGRTR
jgi:hypothetical protein